MSVNITFAAININAQDTDASLSVGENSQVAWSAHAKNNFGNGMLFGVNNTVNFLNNLYDLDGVDAPITDMDFVQANQNQTA